MTWESFLQLMTSVSGVEVILGFLLSWLVGLWPAFQDKPKQIKQAIFALICLIVPLLGTLLGILTLGWDPGWATTWWPALVAAFTAFTSGTLLNAGVKYVRRDNP